MEATLNQRVSQALLVTADDLAALSNALAPHLPPPTAVAECADGLARHFPSVADLVAYDNAPSRGVRSLTLYSRAMDDPCSFSLTLDSDTISNVRSSIRGSEESVLFLKSAVDAFLSATRPPYWPLAGTSFWYLPPFGLVGLALALPVLSYVFRPGSAFFSVGSARTAVFGVIVLVLGSAPVFFASSVDRLRHYLFPTCVFAWQQGKKPADHLSFIRTVILLGIVISAAGSILAALFTSA